MIAKAYYQSAVGLIEIVGTEQTIKSVSFIESAQPIEREQPDTSAAQDNLPAAVDACVTQLDEYFKGERQTFALDLAPVGTDFQKAVWGVLLTVEFGQTASYLDIAKAVGNEKTVRAVGMANGKNPIAIIIPCHRIIGSDGKLTGYNGGLWRKEWLLRHEGVLDDGVEQLTLF